MQVRVALLQEYFRIRLFSLLQLMAYCLLENVSTDEKQNKMYVINTVNATCEIYMLAKCQQIDDWFSENWEVKNLFLHVVPCTKSYTLLWSWALVILPPKITTIFFLVILKGTGRKLKRKKKKLEIKLERIPAISLITSRWHQSIFLTPRVHSAVSPGTWKELRFPNLRFDLYVQW